MAGLGTTDDAATVLENFIHDVANLPAEIAHLLEEVQAKDEIIEKHRLAIHQHDKELQAFVKKNGGAAKHQKDDQYLEEVKEHYDRAQALQDDKCSLANKAAILVSLARAQSSSPGPMQLIKRQLDRHVKRLDLKIKDLQIDGAIADDPHLPSMLIADRIANKVGPSSGAATGANTPINMSLTTASGSSTNVANAAMARMINNNNYTGNLNAPVAGMQPYPLLQGAQRHSREMSAGTESKRRRINTTVPVPSSNLARHSSLGPGTPKASTPGASSRGGSVGPRTKKPGNKKVAPHLQGNLRKRLGKGSQNPKTKARRLMAGKKGTPSSTGDDEESEDDNGSDDENDEEHALVRGKDGVIDDNEDASMLGNNDEDDKLYCFCQAPSHGNMIACDNEDCSREWFHYECVGLREEPSGRWLCSSCRKLPVSKLRLAR